MTETCSNCIFWKPYENSEEDGGECCRFPPIPVFKASGAFGVVFGSIAYAWPDTDAGDWCGEWQPKAGEKPPVQEGSDGT